MRTIVVVSILLPLLLVLGALARYSVAEGERAIVTKGDRIVRVEEPGVRFRAPLRERVYFIGLDYVRESRTARGFAREGAPPCFINAQIIHRLSDPVAAYRWRRAEGLFLPQRSGAGVRSDYNAAREFFEERLKVFLSGRGATSGDDELERFVEGFAEAHADWVGADSSKIVAATKLNLGCERALKPREVGAAPIGPPRRIITRDRPTGVLASEATMRDRAGLLRTEGFSVSEATSDKLVVQLDGVAALFRVVETAAFDACFPDKQGMRIAEARIVSTAAPAIESHLRRARSGDLDRISEQVIVNPRTDAFKRCGVQLAGYDFSAASYQLLRTPGQ